MKTLIEIKAILNAVAAVSPTQLGDMVRDCVQDLDGVINTPQISIGDGGVVKLSAIEASYAKTRQKIHCIKELRGRLNIGLKEAKDIADYWMDDSRRRYL